jgi:peroxiredoxin Q/BCP
VNQEVVRVATGDVAPAFSLANQNGEIRSLSNYSEKGLVAFFYPAAGSPGCSKEAMDFQESLAEFDNLGYCIVGISPDSVAKLKGFEESHDLTFELLSDPDMTAHKAYGAYGEKSIYGRIYRGPLRSTIILDKAGNVEQSLYNVKATGHAKMLLKRLGGSQ